MRAAAAQILKLGKDAPTDTVGFHAQQCVEKYLKAVLVYRSIPFTKTHDIRGGPGDLLDGGAESGGGRPTRAPRHSAKAPQGGVAEKAEITGARL
jgi:hypothetical protein